MARLNKHLRTSLLCAVVILAIVVLIEVTLPHLGVLWHFTHKGEVAIDGHSFIVPSKYFLAHSKGHLSLVRFSPVVPFLSRRSAIAGTFAKMNGISIFPNIGHKRFNREADYLRLKQFLTNDVKQDGLSLQSERNLNTKLGTAYCWQFSDGQVADASCFFEGSPLLVIFQGEARFADDVYLVVGSASKTN